MGVMAMGKGLASTGSIQAAAIFAAAAILLTTACGDRQGWRESLRGKAPAAHRPAAAISHTGPTDDALEEAIHAAFFREDLELFSNVLATVEAGRVQLSGNVAGPHDRLRAAQLVWQHPGVRQLDNRILIDNGPALAGSARDGWISRQIGQRLSGDQEVTAQRFTVETVDQEVYVLGEARTAYELNRVLEHASTVPHVRRVVNQARIAVDS